MTQFQGALATRLPFSPHVEKVRDVFQRSKTIFCIAVYCTYSTVQYYSKKETSLSTLFRERKPTMGPFLLHFSLPPFSAYSPFSFFSSSPLSSPVQKNPLATHPQWLVGGEWGGRPTGKEEREKTGGGASGESRERFHIWILPHSPFPSLFLFLSLPPLSSPSKEGGGEEEAAAHFRPCRKPPPPPPPSPLRYWAATTKAKNRTPTIWSWVCGESGKGGISGPPPPPQGEHVLQPP